ncbi:aminoglycoside 3-N-acetyltransferase [Pelagibacterium halotolerans]|uniref:Aminoglycoside N(3)-acetyltransferase n=1 Tax=Pelagibacterium halotolerans (strain DSM 22347 / JCM 15775 / CGMCC 1.7692 / B2) TaxID=1082931 RepID=G4RCL7_PELHB|nr:aminoglycoside 3-N-acetyltransferase [Pelagibacterium halotolerans]AEQ50689.1 putative aminoglycoside N(3')-acetyltransferase III [Pelagibacterium halotolerans B2]QJR19380.1 aminoglycoside 3-N-acetyltransferase [Pelagibacterium halotolerans]SDZ93107.1 aminoglycoside 3-N-acetyltransferase [Pelagibacterium halotolerans]
MSDFLSSTDLVADLSEIGIRPGHIVMVHAAMSTVGNLINGPDTLIDALLKAVGSRGSIMAYTDWDARYEDLLDEAGRVPTAWRDRIAGFDPARSRAVRDHGIFPEFLRTTPGALRSANPGASMTAMGARADWLVADHRPDYGYGPASPLARLVEAEGKVLMVGAPRDTMTLIHHAEHLADIPNKRIKRWEVPFAGPDGTIWRKCEEFDTSDAVAPQLDGIDYFTAIVTTYLETGRGRRGRIGAADSLLVDAGEMLEHAVAWLERNGR